MSNLMQSEHFTLQPLAEGVYAAIATELGAGFSNAGLVDLGDRTLVFDAFENPQAAADLLKACLQLTGRSPAAVIISHWHPDHWGGLQVFSGCDILATHATQQAIAPIAEEISQEKRDTGRWEAELRESEARLAGETLSDCLLRLPQERVAFIGDIGFFQSQPFMPYGYPTEWVALLKEMAGWGIDTFVPGHGPLGSKTDLALEADYILALEALVQGVVLAGGSVDDALSQTLPAPFDAWQPVGHRFEANVRAAYTRHSAG